MENKVVIFIFILLLVSTASGYTLEEVKSLINESEQDMLKMKEDGIPITRYNDTLLLIKDLLRAQEVIIENNGTPNFNMIIEKLNELKDLKLKAYRARDELRALEFAINQSKDINLTEVMKLYNQAKTEFENERYEECLEWIEKTYDKISELEALQTKVKAFYEATTTGITHFVRSRWKEIISLILAIVIGYLTLHKKIEEILIKRKIKSLELRKKAIRKLIAETQRDYFERGKISETTYHIRIKKYGELMRDVNRQILLLKEILTKKSSSATSTLRLKSS